MVFAIVYIITGVIYYIMSITGMVDYFKGSGKEGLEDLPEFKKGFQKSMGICWKILAYIYMPIMLVMWLLLMIWMIISLPFKRK